MPASVLQVNGHLNIISSEFKKFYPFNAMDEAVASARLRILNSHLHSSLPSPAQLVVSSNVHSQTLETDTIDVLLVGSIIMDVQVGPFALLATHS